MRNHRFTKGSAQRLSAIPHLLAILVVAAMVASCSSGDDRAGVEKRSDKDGGATSSETKTGGSVSFIQDMWIYEQISTLDEDGAEVDLTEAISRHFADRLEESDESVELVDGLTFHRRDELSPALVGPDKTRRNDVEMVAGILSGADGESGLAVLGTPNEAAREPIGLGDRVQLDLSFIADLLEPGDPLILSFGLLQAYGDFSSEGDSGEKDLNGLELFKHRSTEDRLQYLASDDDDAEMMIFGGEIGVIGDAPNADQKSASDESKQEEGSLGRIAPGEARPSVTLAAHVQGGGALMADLPGKSQPMMDGFRRGIRKCGQGSGGFATSCLRRYFKSMHGGTQDSMKLLDCNLSPSATNCEPENEDDRSTTTTTTSTTTTTPTTTTTTPPNPPGRFCIFRCGRSSGDPHISTFDGSSYSMHGIGEFLAAKGGDLEVQIRTDTAGPTAVTWNKVIAIGSGGKRIEIDVDAVKLDGRKLSDSELSAGMSAGGGTLQLTGAVVDFTSKDGHLVRVTRVGQRWLDLWVDLAQDDTDWSGLFGDTDGVRENDLRTSDGSVLDQPLESDEMYKVFAESWRVTNKTSLFSYKDGEDTETFTDRAFPKAPVTLETLPAAARRWAERLCRAAGIEDETAFENCVIDLAVTGDVSMIRSSFSTDTVNGIRDGRLGPDGAEPGNAVSKDLKSTDDNDKAKPYADPWTLTATEIRQDNEENSRLACPPNGSGFRVWGTDVYTDDSSVCTAAVHIGLFTFSSGGEVLIEHVPGLDSYAGDHRNGVESLDWDSWPGSFVFIGARGVPIEGS